MICAPTEADAHHLDTLLATGVANGVEDLKILSGDEVGEPRPNSAVSRCFCVDHHLSGTPGLLGSRRVFQVRTLEPNVEVHSALLSPNTGIADFGEVSRHIASEIAKQPGSDVKVQFEVRAMTRVEE